VLSLKVDTTLVASYNLSMNFRYIIDAEHNCVFIQQFGEVSFEQLWDQEVQFSADPNHIIGMNILRDFTPATIIPGYDVETIKRKARERQLLFDTLPGKNRKVAWVLSNAKDFKVFHQFCAFSRLNHHLIDRQPFRNIGDALKWLNIPEDYEIKHSDLNK